mmetsp:Transcript_32975/g.105071  ORF Transcript_32975/g.105071 Transcript_32975/m.105071 type:complete len:324 (+) Transcript_32975:203-1174(+)
MSADSHGGRPPPARECQYVCQTLSPATQHQRVVSDATPTDRTRPLSRGGGRSHDELEAGGLEPPHALHQVRHHAVEGRRDALQPLVAHLVKGGRRQLHRGQLGERAVCEADRLERRGREHDLAPAGASAGQLARVEGEAPRRVDEHRHLERLHVEAAHRRRRRHRRRELNDVDVAHLAPAGDRVVVSVGQRVSVNCDAVHERVRRPVSRPGEARDAADRGGGVAAAQLLWESVQRGEEDRVGVGGGAVVVRPRRPVPGCVEGRQGDLPQRQLCRGSREAVRRGASNLLADTEGEVLLVGVRHGGKRQVCRRSASARHGARRGR